MIPESHRDLLERPLFAHFATVRPDGSPQVNPTWFAWDGNHLWFTNSTLRRKYLNIQENPAVAVSVIDPDQPYRYLEIRGQVDLVEPDPAASTFLRLAKRYGVEDATVPPDAPSRVVYRMTPRHVTFQ
ncbi:PPOX class F420-dependent oxidoreductase [Kitasatospora sp. NPDC058032]|uniref:PPOX class F420-dependent oxidoreductase n=1 Tax=unclassified Kitasatospora TaxID=2633591 RepID=UPI0033B8F551